jgi:TetR/AcrR family fatty acid metabolism transcriptional regulator
MAFSLQYTDNFIPHWLELNGKEIGGPVMAAGGMAESLGMRSPVKGRILDAAVRLFASNGYENTSTLSIARAAGTSETQLLKNFINKQGLLEAVFAEIMANMLRLVDDVQLLPSSRAKLREFFRLFTLWIIENPALAKMLLLDMRRIREKHGGQVLIAPGTPEFLRRIDRMLEDAERAGQMKCTMRPELIRLALLGAAKEMFRDSFVGEESLRLRICTDEIEEMLDHLLSCFFLA